MDKQELRLKINQYCDLAKLDESIKTQCNEMAGTIDKLQGTSLERYSIAVISIVCMDNYIPLSTRELVNHAGCTFHDLNVTRRLLRRKYGLKEKPRDVRAVVDKLSRHFEFTNEMIDESLELSDAVMNEARLSASSTMVLAASICYVIALINGRYKKLTQYNFANEVGVTDVSVRNNYRKVARTLYEGFEEDNYVPNTERTDFETGDSGEDDIITESGTGETLVQAADAGGREIDS